MKVKRPTELLGGLHYGIWGASFRLMSVLKASPVGYHFHHKHIRWNGSFTSITLSDLTRTNM